MELSTRYEPQEAEKTIYRRWLDAGCFRATPDDRKPYSITIPPPNVTGALHMGHALNHTDDGHAGPLEAHVSATMS